MKIAFFVYPSAFQNKGGGEILLEKRDEFLSKIPDVKIKRFDMWKDKVEDFDILHVFGSVKDCLNLMHVARSRKVKVVLEAIFWSDFRRAIFEHGTLSKKIEMIVRQSMKYIWPAFPSSRRKMFQVSDMIVPNSESEAVQISRFFSIPREKMFVVPNGVDKEFAFVTKDDFVRTYSLENFILYVGRIEPRKNQLNLIKAMEGVNKNLVLIGDPVSGYEKYYEECKKNAGDNINFLGGMEHGDPLLKSAYAACEVFVLPGWFETPGLAALEAGIAGSKLVVTAGGSTKDYFGEHVLYIDPSNISDINAKIKESLNKEKTKELSEYIKNLFIWEKVAEEMVRGYKKVLGKDL